MPEYRVFISRKNLDAAGEKTDDVAIAQELHDHLTKLGIQTFLDDVSLMQQGRGQYKKAIDDALDQAEILVAVSTSRNNLESEWVRYEWDGFFNDIISGIKPGGQVISLVSGLKPAELPRALRQTQSFDFQQSGVKKVGEFLLNALGMPVPEELPPRRPTHLRAPVEKKTLMPTAILFLDIAGSTKLYKDHGEEVADRLLSKALRDWEMLTVQNDGWVIKAIGDEIMCGFETADDCVKAAVEIRNEIAIGLRGESIMIHVKTGLSFRQALRMPDGDVSGEAVNVAASMTGISKPDQILTDAATVASLSPEHKSRCVTLGETKITGNDESITYYRID